MSASNLSASAESFYVPATLPLRWSSQPGQSALEATRYLQVLMLLEHPEDDEPDPLQRRLDLQLLWLGRLLTPHTPPPADVQFGLDDLVWTSTQPLLAGQQGWLDVSLSHEFAYLISLPLEIISAEPQGDTWQIRARYLWPQQSLREAFERVLFSRHRVHIRTLRGASLDS